MTITHILIGAVALFVLAMAGDEGARLHRERDDWRATRHG